MGSNYSKRAKMTWGASFANTWYIQYPLIDWRSSSAPQEGSTWAQVESGEEDSWILQDNYFIEFSVAWIPTTTNGTIATGWDGVAGVRAAIEWMRRKNPLRFYPDATSGTYITSYLVEPMDGAHDLGPDATRSIRVRLRNSTTAYDNY